MLKCIDVVSCERLCIPFNEIKWQMWKSPFFFGFFQLLHLNNGIWIETGYNQITFAYLNITFANFQQDPYSHLQVIVHMSI